MSPNSCERRILFVRLGAGGALGSGGRVGIRRKGTERPQSGQRKLCIAQTHIAKARIAKARIASA